MKLRLKGNSLRLRLNQADVRALAGGVELRQAVAFPNGSTLAYLLTPGSEQPGATFLDNVIRVALPQAMLIRWAESDDIGLYLELPSASAPLLVAIEKDLECVDVAPEERDAEAFPRAFSPALPLKSC